MLEFADQVTIPDKSDLIPVIADVCTADSLAEKVALQVLLDAAEKVITENLAMEEFNVYLME